MTTLSMNAMILRALATNFLTSQDCTAVSIDTRTALARFIGWSWEDTYKRVHLNLKVWKRFTLQMMDRWYIVPNVIPIASTELT